MDQEIQINPSLKKYLLYFGIDQPALHFDSDELNWMTGLITHKFEKDINAKNQFGNWDEFKSPFDFKKPVLDLFITSKTGRKSLSIWPGGHKFAVVLSHDVDRVESYSPKGFIRTLKKRIQFANSTNSKLKLYFNLIKTNLKMIFTKKSSDPLWCYEKWIDLEKKYGANSTFFMFARPENQHLSIHDCDYLWDDTIEYRGKRMFVREFIQMIETEGCELGIHGSIGTHNSDVLFSLQKQELEAVLNTTTQVTRQHYLRYDLAATPDIHAKNGVQVDSTLGLARNIGFRNGASFPYYLSTNYGEVLEVPLTIMDSSLYADQKTLEEAKIEVDRIVDYVEEMGSCLTINFHPDYVVREKFFKLYEYILESLNKRNCEFLSFSQVKSVIDSFCEASSAQSKL
jgi:peptidoglycan/xylan/chitin deacetylase (PgdA/CDA1 family)